VTEEKNEALTQLYEQSFKEIKEGEIVKGNIVRVGVKDVLIDVGYKSEGAVAREEFTGLPDLAVGQEVEVYVDSIEDDNGMIVLSRDKARRLHGWDKINQGFKEGDLVDGFVRKKVKGRLYRRCLRSGRVPAGKPRHVQKCQRERYCRTFF